MLFNSLIYLSLLSFVVTVFWLIGQNIRPYLIFIASLFFYGFWKIEFVPLLLFSVFCSWWLSLQIYKSKGKKRKKLLIISLSINIGILFIFKYLLFFTENAVNFLNLLGGSFSQISLNIILPLGVSFFTFQSISYVVDVYRKLIKPEKKFIYFGCYIIFFPQLVAGPILRAKEVIHQFKKINKFDLSIFLDGARRVVYGLFLKVVLADNLHVLVDKGFSLPLDSLSGIDVWTLAFLFGFQIYFDFSGYSHIAIGSAKLVGIHFPENFNFPYLSNSPREFWKRWHISLSSWVRDYIYLPLSKIKPKNQSLGGLGKVFENKKDIKPLIITWTIMGFWHGANWTFLLWGIYHAIIIILYRLIRNINLTNSDNLKFIIGWFLTTPLIMLSWIPFRANSIDDTFIMWGKVINPLEYNFLSLHENVYLISAIIFIAIIIFYLFKKLLINNNFFSKNLILIGDTIYVAIIFAFTFIFLSPIKQFIYFQF